MDHSNQSIIDTKLKENDFKIIYREFNVPVCDFDCGAECSKNNNGVPICCEQNVVIPVLYSNEMSYISKHSNLWKRFVPKNKADYKLLETCGEDDILATCKGHLKCERDFRSLVCRTFPFYSYIDKDASFVGITYNYEFEGKCVLIGRPEVVSKDYVRSFMKVWSYIYDLDDAEFESSYALSRQIEAKRKRQKKELHIIKP